MAGKCCGFPQGSILKPHYDDLIYSIETQNMSSASCAKMNVVHKNDTYVLCFVKHRITVIEV